jgi:uncharacterized protein
MKLSQLLLVTTITLFSACAYAQTPQLPPPAPPGAVAAANELLAIKKAAPIYQNVIPEIIQRTKDSIVQNNLNYQKDLEEIAVKLAGELGARREEMGNALAQFYATNFTEQELRDLVAFYKSPLGQKYLVQEPKSMDQSINYMRQWANVFSNEVAAKFRAEMHARGKDL